MQDIKTEVVRAIDVTKFWEEHCGWDGENLVECPFTEHHENGDRTPSLSLDRSGKFNCFSCGFHGTTVIGYYTDAVCGGNFRKALARLYQKHIGSLIRPSDLQFARKKLLKRASLVAKITSARGWTKQTMRDFKLGWDPVKKRVLIPIFDIRGFCLDVRYHDSIRQAPLIKGKRVPVLATGKRNGLYFPLQFEPFKKKEVWVVEGEPDAILGVQEGLNCVTVTGGAGAIAGLSYEKLKSFEDCDVVLLLDNDKAGERAAAAVGRALAAIEVASLKKIVVPRGKDLTDYLLEYSGTVRELRNLASAAPYLLRSGGTGPTPHLHLSETSEAQYAGRHVSTDVLVSGQSASPFLIPERIKLSCHGDEFCSRCPCRDGDTGTAEYIVQSEDPRLLDFLFTRTERLAALMGSIYGTRRGCEMRAEVKSWQNVERVSLIPALTSRASKSRYVVRQGFYLGHGLEANKPYRISAIPQLHPKSSESVLLVRKVEGTNDSLDEIRLTKTEVYKLRTIFSDPPGQVLKEVADVLSANATKIRCRRDLHVAVDLCFHSIASFSFSGVQLPKGSIELLLLGDTRCGKGATAEGLCHYYDLGAVVSGENASLVGLLGGCTKTGDAFGVSWGAIPLNNRRLVVIDEFSGLDADILGRLSRVRSEGIAEINKGGIHSQTNSNARLIWIANPKKGKEVLDSGTGVQAILELVGTQEDVARFDLALVVAKGEVSPEKINKADRGSVNSKYTRQVLRQVLLWAWSRKPEHVLFSKKASDFIHAEAVRLAGVYSSAVPLIQGENARFKLAKIAAAIAARCFSTQDGVHLRVKVEHARWAAKFLQMIYDKDIMGYRLYSEARQAKGEITSPEKVDRFFRMQAKRRRRDLVEALLEHDQFDVNDFADWLNVDRGIAVKYVGNLVRSNCLKRARGRMYVKRPAFIKYLKERMHDE